MPATAAFGHAPDADTLLTLAEAALDSLPEAFRAAVAPVLIRVEDFAGDDVLADLGIDSPYELTGLYSGRPLTEKSIDDSGHLPDTVLLYRVPILLEWVEGGEDLGWLVRHVLIHEIGHHFGFSDADIDAIEAAAD